MKDLSKQIAVCDNGFVYVGDCLVDDRWLYIHNARNIRVWGTEKGLGELRNGPTRKTITDETGDVLVPLNRVCHFIKVQGGWS